MRTVTLVSRDPLVQGRLRRLLDGALDVLPLESLRDAAAPGSGRLADVLLVDLATARAADDDWGFVRAQPGRPFLVGLMGSEGADATGAEHCDLVIPASLPDAALRATIEQGFRVRRLEMEVLSLRRERARPDPGAPLAPTAAHVHGSLGTVLKEMGKLLAAHFDLERVIDFFLDAITELVRPGRTVLLLADGERAYRIRGQRGLALAFGDRLRLEAEVGLCAWFREQARLAVRAELEREPEWLDAARELAALGGDVAVPLWVQAKLVGVLTLGPRVTGQPYGAEELERLFTLSSQVAMAVEDIALFNTVRAQHGFIEQVLAHLQSGAVTIDATGRITRFNRRAEEVLGLARTEVLGRDLRALPSPLGDLLFETMRDGRELRLQEVSVARRGAVLEVSTSRIFGPAGPAGAAAGAVMIFDDPTPRHLLHRERQTSQTLDLLNRVLLRLTDEIKNPLVSIYTFLELLPQRYDDPEFRETFLTVVGKDTQRLISLVDKLITLAGEREYKVDFCDLRQILNDTLEEVALRFERAPGPSEGALFLLQAPERQDRLTAVLFAPETGLTVRADRDQLGKALGYLFRFLINRVAPDGRVAIHALPDPDEPHMARLSIVGRPADLSEVEREQLFSPLAIALDKLFDVGPGVSQKIVEAHGGTLALGGQDGEIRFVLTLPRTPA